MKVKEHKRVKLESIYMKRPMIIIDTFNVGTEEEHTIRTPYYGASGYIVNNMYDGKFAYDVFYDDVFGGVIYADKLELAKPIALAHKDSEFYFCNPNAEVRVQRRNHNEDRLYDKYGVLVNYKPRKSATLCKAEEE